MNTKAGERLWETDHQGKESKLGTDTKSMQEAAQFAFLQSYAPYVQQVVNVGLATLPRMGRGLPQLPPRRVASCQEEQNKDHSRF